MAKTKHTGLGRLFHATIYSWQGLKAAFRHEEAFQLELLFLFVAIPLALWLGDNVIERVLLISSYLLIMIIEVINSAIEAVVDRTGEEYHKLAGRAKDMGSAAVALSIVNALLVWGLLIIF